MYRRDWIGSKFLSTLPARGATPETGLCAAVAGISIHAPREGSDPAGKAAGRHGRISIHAPREGSDAPAPCWSRRSRDFYPRSPRGERPRTAAGRARCPDFYPRSPRGERPVSSARRSFTGAFLSTLPARGATVYMLDLSSEFDISIHAPREGSDAFKDYLAKRLIIFLSTLPARGATLCPRRLTPTRTYFYPRSPRGERHLSVGHEIDPIYFYPRSPRGERPAQ